MTTLVEARQARWWLKAPISQALAGHYIDRDQKRKVPVNKVSGKNRNPLKTRKMSGATRKAVLNA